MDISKTTHFKFVDLREDNDLTQKDIAKKLGIKRSRYSMWESGKRDFPIEYANELANIYNVSFDYLFDLSNTKHKNLRKEIDFNLLAKRLKFLRKEKNLSQYTLGQKIGFSQRAYSYYESSKIIPTCKTIRIFAVFFNVSIDYLIGKTDDKNII